MSLKSTRLSHHAPTEHKIQIWKPKEKKKGEKEVDWCHKDSILIISGFFRAAILLLLSLLLFVNLISKLPEKGISDNSYNSFDILGRYYSHIYKHLHTHTHTHTHTYIYIYIYMIELLFILTYLFSICLDCLHIFTYKKFIHLSLYLYIYITKSAIGLLYTNTLKSFYWNHNFAHYLEYVKKLLI